MDLDQANVRVSGLKKTVQRFTPAVRSDAQHTSSDAQPGEGSSESMSSVWLNNKWVYIMLLQPRECETSFQKNQCASKHRVIVCEFGGLKPRPVGLVSYFSMLKRLFRRRLDLVRSSHFCSASPQSAA